MSGSPALVIGIDGGATHTIAVLADAVSRSMAAVYRQRFDLSRDEWRLLAALADDRLQTLWEHAGLTGLHALVAVGGYGRRELYPASDVDLLFLVPDDVAAETERQLERLIGLLWDIGLDIGAKSPAEIAYVEKAAHLADLSLDEAPEGAAKELVLLAEEGSFHGRSPGEVGRRA